MVQDNSLPLPLIVQVDFEVFGNVQGEYPNANALLFILLEIFADKFNTQLEFAKSIRKCSI